VEVNDDLPFDREAEMAVLGSMILDANIINDLSSVIKARDFVLEEHQDMFKGMMDFYFQEGIDRMSVRDLVIFFKTERRLTTIDHGGVGHFIAQLAQAAPVTSHWNYYADRVRLISMKRDCFAHSLKMLKLCQDTASSSNELVSTTADMQMSLADSGKTKIMDLKDLMIEHVVDPAKNQELLVAAGVSSGLWSWDNLVGGLRPGSLNVIAARPSVGKSTLAPIFAASVVEKTGKTALFFSLEMLGESWAWREFSRLSGIKGKDLRANSSKGLSDKDLTVLDNTLRDLEENKYLIIDKPDLDVSQITGISKVQDEKTPLGCIVIDYIQLVSAIRASRSRHEEVGDISGKLKQLAKELKIPIICLGQLNRSGEPGNPQISQMAQADKISMDADTVTLIHRAVDDAGKKKPSEKANARERLGENKERIDAEQLADMRLQQGLEDLIITVDKARDGERGRFPVTHHKGLFKIEEPGTQEDQTNAAFTEAKMADIEETGGDFGGFNEGEEVEEPDHGVVTQNLDNIPF
tara:strand:+ start:2154 stop:3722 length:1569 start_codon:yes stop_codon:yes gene_type:complete